MQTFVVLSDDATMSAQVSAALPNFKVLTDVDFQSFVKHALLELYLLLKYIGHGQRWVDDAVLVLEEVSLGLKSRLAKV